jgi:hypothetical protein
MNPDWILRCSHWAQWFRNSLMTTFFIIALCSTFFHPHKEHLWNFKKLRPQFWWWMVMPGNWWEAAVYCKQWTHVYLHYFWRSPFYSIKPLATRVTRLEPILDSTSYEPLFWFKSRMGLSLVSHVDLPPHGNPHYVFLHVTYRHWMISTSNENKVPVPTFGHQGSEISEK